MNARVIPAPTTPSLASGEERAIAFGGGGEWFTCWTLAYAATAKAHGVDLSNVDVTVGTSAGSIMGSYLTSGRVDSAYAQFKELAAHPEALEKMVVTDTGAESQVRATKVLSTATSTGTESIKEIARAAMASRNASAETYETSLEKLLFGNTWPSQAHHVTAIDCYTGERVIIAHDSGIPIATACAASSSVPGVNGPVWIDDHYCMDGGISTSSTHSDLVAGAKRVIVFSLMSQAPKSGAFGFAMRIDPDSIHAEVRYLESQGSKVMLICANPADGTTFMDPAQMALALELGAARAAKDAAALAAFWND